MDDLDRRFPEDTSVRFTYLPTLRALLSLHRGEPARALEQLQVSIPYEVATPRSATHGNFGAMYPVYFRGEAYLAQKQGQQAAAEFSKILSHRGVVANDPIGALARMQLARAYALTGNRDKAKMAYAEFLELWKNADPDTPILKQAVREYKKLR
jgi:predicted Zn-dependent protease